MKKRVWRTLAAGRAAVLVLACWAACQGDDALPAALGVGPELGQVADHWDDHGGMGNDGSAYWEVTFSPEEAAALEQALPAAEGWQPLPLSDEARRLLYGTDGMEETGEGAFLSMSPYLTKQDGSPLFPQLEEGYWFFYDKQTGTYTAEGVKERPSCNFIAALYDPAAHTLYCGELDT